MKKYDYPDVMEIKPVTKPVNATIRVPGSKSITNRALVLGALASREVEKVYLIRPLISDDTEVLVHALKSLGFKPCKANDGDVVSFDKYRSPNEIPKISADLYVANSGTSMRFLTALVAIGFGQFRIFGDNRMHERPIGDLLDGLRQMGVDAISERNTGCPPVLIRSAGLKGGHITIQGSTSSQFISALLMIAPYAARETTIQIHGPIVSKPYIDMTLRMMSQAGVGVVQPSATSYRVPAKQRYRCTRIEIEPDASAASYFFGAAAITDGIVAIRDLEANSIQGDLLFRNALAKMGCSFGIRQVKGPFAQGSAMLHGIEVDMNAISDTVMTLAAVACFAEGPTTIRNVAHIRHKECDRITALCTELRKLGVEVEEYPDGLKITPRPMHGAVIETYNDHRMAMSMALIGLKVPGVVIKNPACVAKTYPGYWEDFQRLYE